MQWCLSALLACFPTLLQHTLPIIQTFPSSRFCSLPPASAPTPTPTLPPAPTPDPPAFRSPLVKHGQDTNPHIHLSAGNRSHVATGAKQG
ncbi:hypothetical protein F4780DRAFT_739674 [Xylariomycetidae sp. FL0641]|nr:hypothetical protein F4780DRAFT_739674 [Xylariomycetidae sp. FL0641]